MDGGLDRSAFDGFSRGMLLVLSFCSALHDRLVCLVSSVPFHACCFIPSLLS